nr:immunoglobulin light chain junction region [Macaca mulatta]MOV98989.1 immunoglobulin light chain junction region [Macaca mulatta]
DYFCQVWDSTRDVLF